MTTKIFIIEVHILALLCFIPWPGPTVFKISCPREHASVVRRVVLKKWIPILEKHHVFLPLECPFHPIRDIYWPQQAAKQQFRSSQWTCGLCGKSFYDERFLDMHFDNKHKNKINMAEDAVCLADYCDIMRCEVLMLQDAGNSNIDPSHSNTDVEIWSESTAYHTALTPAGPRDLACVVPRAAPQGQKTVPVQQHCSTNSNPSVQGSPSQNAGESDDGNNATGDVCQNNNLVDSAVPPGDFKQNRISEIQKLKSNCKPEELQQLKLRCEIIVRDCIAGLLVNLSIESFKEVEEELNKAVCWYLTCDRYWEDSPAEIRHVPWGLVFVFVMALSLGICMCYYIIWVIFDSDDTSVASTTATATSSPLHQANSTKKGDYGDDYEYGGQETNEMDQHEHFIYVTYPPELKRRLLESCYNRTTRL